MNEEKLIDARLSLSALFKARREELNLTQQELADLCGFNRATIIRWEAGEFWPGMKQYLIICDKLGLTNKIISE